ncbi:MAG: smalltalk protein [Bacteroidaceae bacterium]|nr:smalltalk protein [Bacteroidaceae bacterium]
MRNKNLFELIAKIIVAALTAALTALTTTSCMGHGPVDALVIL